MFRSISEDLRARVLSDIAVRNQMAIFYTTIQLNTHSTVYGSTLVYLSKLTIKYSNRINHIFPGDFSGLIFSRPLRMTPQAEILIIMVHPLSPYLACFFFNNTLASSTVTLQQ